MGESPPADLLTVAAGPTAIADLAGDLRNLIDDEAVAGAEHAEALMKPFEQLRLDGYRDTLDAFETFLPPRLVRAAKEGGCIPFFGAGVSVEADVPLWWALLTRLGVSRDLISEPELEHDPLTAAEVLAHQIGLPMLEKTLRNAIERATVPALPHLLLAALRQDVYVTTNYDCLFEIAWETLHGVRPRVVTTNADLAALGPPDSWEKEAGKPILFKLHGSADRDAEELILTRGQYRRHYRTNREMFELVRSCLSRSHTLFVGFGHRDPEITRLVEDVIHAFEAGRDADAPRPAFYSLQFKMGERTPEIFAARGIVALQPPISLGQPDGVDPRTAGLTHALIDLQGAVDSEVHRDLDLDADLSRVLERVEGELGDAFEVLEGLAGKGAAAIGEAELAAAEKRLGALAGQGVYLLGEADGIVEHWVPDGLRKDERRKGDFHRRPYAKQARMYREPFVSNTIASRFNGNSTAFLCVPILSPEREYRGLLFSAFQVGAWDTPDELRRSVRDAHPGREVSFLLVDSDGVLLLPPNGEFEPREASVDGEPGEANRGFEYEQLRRLSRRDRLVGRIWNNIVPLGQDDDVLELADVKIYSVVAEVARTRWKLAISIPTSG